MKAQGRINRMLRLLWTFLFGVSSAAVAQEYAPLPEKLVTAKSVYLVNESGDLKAYDSVLQGTQGLEPLCRGCRSRGSGRHHGAVLEGARWSLCRNRERDGERQYCDGLGNLGRYPEYVSTSQSLGPLDIGSPLDRRDGEMDHERACTFETVFQSAQALPESRQEVRGAIT
jgi:hypothetical protein